MSYKYHHYQNSHNNQVPPYLDRNGSNNLALNENTDPSTSRYTEELEDTQEGGAAAEPPDNYYLSLNSNVGNTSSNNNEHKKKKRSYYSPLSKFSSNSPLSHRSSNSSLRSNSTYQQHPSSCNTSPSFPFLPLSPSLLTKRIRTITPSPPSYPILMTGNGNCNLRRPRKAVRFCSGSEDESGLDNVTQNPHVTRFSKEEEEVDEKVYTTWSGEVYDRTPIEPMDPSTSLCLPKRDSEKCCWIKCLERSQKSASNIFSNPSNLKKNFKLALEKMEGNSVNVRRVKKTSPLQTMNPSPIPVQQSHFGNNTSGSSSEEEVEMWSSNGAGESEDSCVGSMEREVLMDLDPKRNLLGIEIDGVKNQDELEDEDDHGGYSNKFSETEVGDNGKTKDEDEDEDIGLDMDGITDADGDDNEPNEEECEEDDDNKSVCTSIVTTDVETDVGESELSLRRDSCEGNSKQDGQLKMGEEMRAEGLGLELSGPFPLRQKSHSLSSIHNYNQSNSQQDEITPKAIKYLNLSSSPTNTSSSSKTLTPKPQSVINIYSLSGNPLHDSPNVSVESLGERVDRLLKKDKDQSRKDSAIGGLMPLSGKGSGSSVGRGRGGRYGMCGMGKWTRDEVYKSCDAFGGF